MKKLMSKPMKYLIVSSEYQHRIKWKRGRNVKNMLSVEDAKRFISKNKFLILISGIVTVLVYVAFALYNLYAATVLEEVDVRHQELSQDEIVEILNREPEDIRADDLMFIQESLDANAKEFRVFIELIDQTPFNDPGLLKDFLIMDDVVDFVEAEAGVDLPIDRDLAVIIERRYGHPVLSVVVRTGDIDDNRAIAEAYMTALEEEVVPLTAQRNVFFLDDEPDFFEPRMITQILESIRVFSPMSIIAGSVVAGLAGIGIGMLLGVLRGMQKKKVDEFSILQDHPTDILLPLYKLKDQDDVKKQISYAIDYPPNRKKVLITEFDKHDLLAEYQTRADLQIVKDLSDADPTRIVDEVILLTQMDETGMNWYKNQRLQMNNLKAEVKVIQI